VRILTEQLTISRAAFAPAQPLKRTRSRFCCSSPPPAYPCYVNMLPWTWTVSRSADASAKARQWVRNRSTHCRCRSFHLL